MTETDGMSRDAYVSWLVEHRDTATAKAVLASDTLLPSASEIMQTMRCGILSWPYLEVFHGGKKLPYDAVFTKRTVQQTQISDFVHLRNVLGRFQQGATWRFPSVADWMTDIRPLAEATCLGLGRDVATVAYMATGSASLAIPQIAGDAVAIVCSGKMKKRSGWESDPSECSVRTDYLQPGDVVYVPSDENFEFVADETDSLLLVFGSSAPDARKVIKVLQDMACEHVEGRAEMQHHHMMTVGEKAEWVLGELRGFYGSLTSEELLRVSSRDV